MARRKPSKRRNRPPNGFQNERSSGNAPLQNRLAALNPNYILARASLLDGTAPGDKHNGGWPITAKRVMYGWGLVTVDDWPYSPDQSQHLGEPEGLDEKAKALRIQYYQRLCNLDECKRALFARKGVTVSLPATRAWFDAERGEIPEIGSKSEIVGVHSVVLLGYSDDQQKLQFANSWGKEWGVGGIGFISYNYYEKWSHETWMMDLGFDSRQVANETLFRTFPRRESLDPLELMWGVEDPLRPSSQIHCREIYDFVSDERMGWAFATTRGGFLDIDDFFVRPSFRRKGYGSRIARMLMDLSANAGMPLKLRVSFADVGLENREALHGILRSLGLSLRNTNQRELAYIALAGKSARELEPIVIPERPTLSRGSGPVAISVPSSIITAISVKDIDVGINQLPDAEAELSWRREAEKISPSNIELRALIGKFAPPAGTFGGDEEMPY